MMLYEVAIIAKSRENCRMQNELGGNNVVQMDID